MIAARTKGRLNGDFFDQHGLNLQEKSSAAALLFWIN
jgi:hypothetical protein